MVYVHISQHSQMLKKHLASLTQKLQAENYTIIKALETTTDCTDTDRETNRPEFRLT